MKHTHAFISLLVNKSIVLQEYASILRSNSDVQMSLSFKCIDLRNLISMTVFLSKINKMVRLVKKPLGLIPPGRRVSVRESDIFVTSYPKSGNTWVRFLISNMMYPDGSTDFKNVNDRVPDIYTVPSRSLEKYSKPRIMKSHEYFDPRYKKVLYIVRDVRSVIVSYFHHKQLAGSINSNTSIGEFTDLFMAGEIDGFGDWQDNVASWFLLRGDSGDQFKMLKYEEIKNDPYASCEAIYDFLDLEYTPEDVERSVGYSDFDTVIY